MGFPHGHRTATARPPHGHRKTTTLVAGLRLSGIVAPMVLDGPINGDWFEAYVRHVLAPALRPGDVVIMDILPVRKRPAARAAIEAAGARLVFLTPSAPDFNPIEFAFSKRRALPQKGRRANRRGPLGRDRPPRRSHRPGRERKPLHRSRI